MLYEIFIMIFQTLKKVYLIKWHVQISIINVFFHKIKDLKLLIMLLTFSENLKNQKQFTRETFTLIQ